MPAAQTTREKKSMREMFCRHSTGESTTATKLSNMHYFKHEQLSLSNSLFSK